MTNVKAVGFQPTITHWIFFSAYHRWSAMHFAALSTKVEEIGHMDDPLSKQRNRAYATGAVLLSVAFLEASINELHLNIRSGRKQATEGLSEESKIQLSTSLSKARGVISKYDSAYSSVTRKPLIGSVESVESARLLVKLRNRLVHYEPTKLGVSDHPIEEGLDGLFPLNPFFAGHVFPDKYLGSGCAEWAVYSSTRFVDDFFAHIGCKPPYQYVNVWHVPADA